MFRQFATLVSPDLLFNAHPFELAWLLEDVWRGHLDLGTSARNLSLGDPDRRSNLKAMPQASAPNGWPPLATPELRLLIDPIFQGDDHRAPFPRWDHLIYAYMVENTRRFMAVLS